MRRRPPYHHAHHRLDIEGIAQFGYTPRNRFNRNCPSGRCDLPCHNTIDSIATAPRAVAIFYSLKRSIRPRRFEHAQAMRIVKSLRSKRTCTARQRLITHRFATIRIFFDRIQCRSSTLFPSTSLVDW